MPGGQRGRRRLIPGRVPLLPPTDDQPHTPRTADGAGPSGTAHGAETPGSSGGTRVPDTDPATPSQPDRRIVLRIFGGQ